jgi:hypothetical protein
MAVVGMAPRRGETGVKAMVWKSCPEGPFNPQPSVTAPTAQHRSSSGLNALAACRQAGAWGGWGVCAPDSRRIRLRAQEPG